MALNITFVESPCKFIYVPRDMLFASMMIDTV